MTAPAYGRVHVSGNYPGDYAVFSCTYGYSVIGKSRIVCLHTGVWDGSVPSCKKDYYDDKYHYDGPKLNEVNHDDDYYYDDDYKKDY